MAGATVNGVFERGFLCYGVPIGTDAYVKHVLYQKAKEITDGAERASEVLAGDRQALWAVLKWSISQQFDYWLQLVYPSPVREAASMIDNVLWRVMETAAGGQIPRTDEGKGWECVIDPPIDSLRGRSFQEWVVRQPVKMGGMGLRSLADLSPAAYIGAVEQAVPCFTGIRGVCPVLSNVVGGEECFNRAAPTDTRWRIMFKSGCRVGQEYKHAWDLMRQEAVQGAAFLDEDLDGQLAVAAEGAGNGSSTGATRKAVVEQREMTRGKVLAKCLKEYHDRLARPAWSWPQRDKLSSQWLLALPAPGSDMSSAVFAEAFASHLCLPSPACEGRVGEKLGRATVDRYGDSVQAAALPGDGWRTRHDSIKLLLSSLCRWAGLPVRCEVFGLFAHLIPQVGLSRIERGRKCQGLFLTSSLD